jgi:oxalate decarboxylase/phosphoglucose isomerase-like protein (cupin superfamily)
MNKISVYQTTQWPKDSKGAIRICISDNTMSKRYQRDNQNLYIRQHNDQKIAKGQSESVYQTTQWPKDTKGTIRICISDNTMTKRYQRDNQNLYIRQHNDQQIPKGQSESVYQTTQWPKDTKGTIRICISDNTMTKRHQRGNQNLYIRQDNDQKIAKGKSESVYQTTQWPKDTKGEIRICISDNTMTKRYQRGNQNMYIRQHNDQKIPKGQPEYVYQTTQCPKDTKGTIRICISDNTMTKRYQRVIRICISDNTMTKR